MLLIALTGWGRDVDREHAFGAGFDHHLVKPVNSARLLQIVLEGTAATTEPPLA